jgi:hypothetical protein
MLAVEAVVNSHLLLELVELVAEVMVELAVVVQPQLSTQAVVVEVLVLIVLVVLQVAQE